MENRDTDKLKKCRSESCTVDTAGIWGHNREESHTESSQSPHVDSLQAPDEEAWTYAHAVKAVQRIAGNGFYREHNKECTYSQDETSTDNPDTGKPQTTMGSKIYTRPTQQNLKSKCDEIS